MSKSTIFHPRMYDKSTDIILLLLRLAFGGLMLINHGWGKMNKLFGEEAIKFADPFGLGMEATLGLTVFAEVLCAGLLVFGLFTRWAAIPLVITMLVAIFIIHGADPFGKKEMAILYLIPYIAIMMKGAGRYSLDYLLGNRL